MAGVMSAGMKVLPVPVPVPAKLVDSTSDVSAVAGALAEVPC